MLRDSYDFVSSEVDTGCCPWSFSIFIVEQDLLPKLLVEKFWGSTCLCNLGLRLFHYSWLFIWGIFKISFNPPAFEAGALMTTQVLECNNCYSKH